MPQWVELPPNLVSCAQTNGKSIYATDYSSRRPGFQIHLQKTARGLASSHHPRIPKDPSKSLMRASQTASYMGFKDEYDKKLSEKTARNVSGLIRRTPPSSHGSKDSEVHREVLSEYIKPSLDLVRQAWNTEKDAANRDRERLYGLAGKKVDFVPRPPATTTEQRTKTTERVLPGMKNWLQKSNEYEKAVVSNFMDHVAKATVAKETKQLRPKTCQPTKTQFPNEYFYKQRTKSAQSQRVTQQVDLPPRPKSVHSFKNKITVEGTQEQTTNQHSHPNHTHHAEGKCEFCDYLRVKQLLEYLNSHDSNLGEATLRHLLRPRVNPGGYPTYEDYDYIHENSFFSFTNARDRGYFIIAPDWVSERKGISPPKYRA